MFGLCGIFAGGRRCCCAAFITPDTVSDSVMEPGCLQKFYNTNFTTMVLMHTTTKGGSSSVWVCNSPRGFVDSRILGGFPAVLRIFEVVRRFLKIHSLFVAFFTVLACSHLIMLGPKFWSIGAFTVSSAQNSLCLSVLDFTSTDAECKPQLSDSPTWDGIA